MCLIGVTGLPGSGKSMFTAVLAAQGARTISADAIGHEVIQDPSVAVALQHEFDQGIVGSDGRVDRARLGRLVDSPDRVDALNRIVHPLLLERLAARVRDALADASDVVAVDAALIPEWEIYRYFDLVVFVAAPAAERFVRLGCAGRDLRLIRVLELSQLSEEAKRERCHVIVENLSTVERLQQRAVALFDVLTRVRHKEESCPRRLWTG